MTAAPATAIGVEVPAPQFIDWEDIARRLREPFDPNDVDYRVQGKASEQTGKAQCVPYVDARVVQDRLDAVVGIGNWSFDWQPLVVDKGNVMVAKGTITIYGVSKSDAGSASNFEQSLGAVSHCFKRAAVHWGIGRYLYNLPMSWVAVERGGRIPAQVLRELRAQLPRPNRQPPAARVVDATVGQQARLAHDVRLQDPAAMPPAQIAAPAAPQSTEDAGERPSFDDEGGEPEAEDFEHEATASESAGAPETAEATTTGSGGHLPMVPDVGAGLDALKRYYMITLGMSGSDWGKLWNAEGSLAKVHTKLVQMRTARVTGQGEAPAPTGLDRNAPAQLKQYTTLDGLADLLGEEPPQRGSLTFGAAYDLIEDWRKRLQERNKGRRATATAGVR